MSESNELTILLVDPLPCSITTKGGGMCGKPATIALVHPAPATVDWPMPGRWLLQPICQDCFGKLREFYEEKEKARGKTP